MNMRRPRLRVILAGLCLLSAPRLSSAQPVQPLPYRDPRVATGDRVRDLLGRMTLEEKFWQLFMIPGDLDNPANDYSNGVFGLQISAAQEPATEPSSRAQNAARTHAERINAIQ